MFCYLGATENFSSEQLNLEPLKNCRVLYTEGYLLYNKNLVQKALRYAKKHGALISFDLSSPRVIRTLEKEIFNLISKDIDILFANEEEAMLLTGLSPQESCRALAKVCPIVVVKVGKDGCWIASKDITFYCKGYPVNALDTTGAGDLFASGFLHAYLEGHPLPICGDWGNRLGSKVVQVIGSELPADQWDFLKQ